MVNNRILILSAYSPERAGIIAYDLNAFFNNRDDISRIMTFYYSGNEKNIISYHTRFNIIISQLVRYIKKRLNINVKKTIKSDPKYHFFSVNDQKIKYSAKRIIRKANFIPDAIFLVFTEGFINARIINELHKLTEAKIFWLFGDMAPMTGGCHYAWDCNGYRNSCGKCPALNSDNANDISYENIRYKQNYLRSIDLTIIAASEWIFNQIKESTLFKNKSIIKILLPIDPEIYKPVLKSEVKNELKLPLDSKIVFFGSVHFSEERKGMKYLQKALMTLSEMERKTNFRKKIYFITAGKKYESFFDNIPFEYKNLGFLNNGKELAKAFQAADLFICPSIEDSGPMMINQSVMCGTPVVSFRMGVAPDLVITNITGYSAVLRDSKDMANGISAILNLDEKKYQQMTLNCRKLALDTMHPDKVLKQYYEYIK